MTTEGGVNHTSDFPDGAGVAFELSPNGSTWTQTVLYNFCSQPNCTDGASPSSPLVRDNSGGFLGATVRGGNKCTVVAQEGTCGAVFSLSPNGSVWQEAILYAFCLKRDCRDGAFPQGSLALDSVGNLWGTTLAGGGNDIDEYREGGGVLFRLNGSTYKVMHAFCALANCADGEYPQAGVVIDPTGTLYGTTTEGGASQVGGTVFKLKP